MSRGSWLIGVLYAGTLVAAEPAIDGASAPLWKPCTGWVKNQPASYGVATENEALVFKAEGAGTEMPWIVELRHFAVTGNERYLVVRYRATGMSTDPNVYFLHGEEGSHGGRNYAKADALVVDGQWHALAVDLVAIEPLQSTHDLVVKVHVAGAPRAELTIEKMSFVDQLPEGARVAPLPPRPPFQSVAVDWGKFREISKLPGQWPAPLQLPAANRSRRHRALMQVVDPRSLGEQHGGRAQAEEHTHCHRAGNSTASKHH